MATKPRGIGDLGLKGTGFEESAPNGGFELKLTTVNNPKLDYPSNTSFADDCATVRPAYGPGEFMVQQFDWCARTPVYAMAWCPTLSVYGNTIYHYITIT